MLEQDIVRTKWDEAFRSAVIEGLSRPRKTIPSCWLYDERGSRLFEEITCLDEYYPTRTETEILSQHAREIADFCGDGALLIEYGAGAAIKTEILIEALKDARLYVPIDIASEMVERTARRIDERFPRLETFPIVADFNHDFDLPVGLPPGRRTAFFPGSTIGNLNRKETVAFLRRLRRHVGEGGTAIIGVDLKKDVATLVEAYDDRAGVTAAFDLNLLARINRELDGEFPLERFVHEARWNETDSAIEMHLVSLDARTVQVCGGNFHFRAGESIHTESSRKYDPDDFAALAGLGLWRVARLWQDRKKLFALFGLDAGTADD